MEKGRPDIKLSNTRSHQVPEGSYEYALLKEREDLTRDWLEYHFGVRYFGKFRQGLELLRSNEVLQDGFSFGQRLIVRDILETVERLDQYQNAEIVRMFSCDCEEHSRTYHNPHR